ncbi:hypothetical protein M501DRAFT_1001906 [Patellaria atrata CBS 101060]|uniref:Ribosomal protein S36, mitochondrial n=1 Tax=Patellaria atrata CBS 101060 TaxID=1346257 RepID=A0A9P4VPH7_9PEZI|nr:hypothetical protein M501DRAFT_1001906 [Patellaria atrata CBS 101060]
MQATRRLLQHRQPMIRFLGKRSPPSKVDHTPHAHPAAPSDALPDSFASYRQKAQQHGPLIHKSPIQYSYGAIGGHSGASLGPINADKGQYFDRSELPTKFGRLTWTQVEIEAVESGGASLFG